jgi:hypothetical protein
MGLAVPAMLSSFQLLAQVQANGVVQEGADLVPIRFGGGRCGHGERSLFALTSALLDPDRLGGSEAGRRVEPTAQHAASRIAGVAG